MEGCAKAPVPSFRAEEAPVESALPTKREGHTVLPGWGMIAAQVPGPCPPTLLSPPALGWPTWCETNGLEEFRKPFTHCSLRLDLNTMEELLYNEGAKENEQENEHVWACVFSFMLRR